MKATKKKKSLWRRRVASFCPSMYFNSQSDSAMYSIILNEKSICKEKNQKNFQYFSIGIQDLQEMNLFVFSAGSERYNMSS